MTVTFNSIGKGMKLEFLHSKDDDNDDDGGDFSVKLDHQSNKQDGKVNKVKSKKRRMKVSTPQKHIDTCSYEYQVQ